MTDEIRNTVEAASDQLSVEDWQEIISAILGFATKLVVLIREFKDI